MLDGGNTTRSSLWIVSELLEPSSGHLDDPYSTLRGDQIHHLGLAAWVPVELVLHSRHEQ